MRNLVSLTTSPVGIVRWKLWLWIGIFKPAEPYSGSTADAWQSLVMFVNSLKMLQRISHSVWQWRWGQVVNLHTGDAHMAVLTIPRPHRLNWTVDTALTSHGTWLVIVRDGGCYDPLLGLWVSEWASQRIACLLLMSLLHMLNADC